VPPDSIEAFLRGYEALLVALIERDLCLQHAVDASGAAGTTFLGRADADRRTRECACAG
jgi:hypothetical protein